MGRSALFASSAPWREIFFQTMANSASCRNQIWRRVHRESTGPNPLLTGSSLNGRGKSCFLSKFLWTCFAEKKEHNSFSDPLREIGYGSPITKQGRLLTAPVQPNLLQRRKGHREQELLFLCDLCASARKLFFWIQCSRTLNRAGAISSSSRTRGTAASGGLMSPEMIS